MPCLYTPYQYAHAYDDCNSTCTHAPLPMLMWFHDAELAAQEEKGQKRKHEQERGDEDVGPSGRVGEGGGMALEEKGKRKKMKVEAVDVLVASTQVAEAERDISEKEKTELQRGESDESKETRRKARKVAKKKARRKAAAAATANVPTSTETEKSAPAPPSTASPSTSSPAPASRGGRQRRSTPVAGQYMERELTLKQDRLRHDVKSGLFSDEEKALLKESAETWVDFDVGWSVGRGVIRLYP